MSDFHRSVEKAVGEIERLRVINAELLEALQALADRVGVLAANTRPPAINELELIKAVEAIAKARGER